MPRILCILLLFSFPVCAQTYISHTPSQEGPKAPTIQYTAADTIAALHRMFHNRRSGGATLLGASLLTIAVAPVVGANNGPPTGYGALAGLITGVQIGLGLTVPMTAIGINLVSKYSKAKEEQAIALYKEKNVLSPKLRRKLRPRLFLTPEVLSPYR
jgi:hypothetical protein